MTLLNLNRYQASACHLAISLLIFLVILLCITQLWYPGILFDTGNAWKAIGLIIGIDLILGPLLTLIIFNPKKSSLNFDLTVIGIVQILALAYGTWTIQSSHPLAIAYINTSFVTFYANAENAEGVKEKVNSLNTNQLFYIFDDEIQGEGLNVDQLFPYTAHAQSVPTIKTPNISILPNPDELLVSLDPLASSNRHIVINKKNGAIIRFSNSKPDNNSDFE